MAAINDWMAKQNDPSVNRAQAVRRLVELGLKVKS
jgi:hypothetical protein